LCLFFIFCKFLVDALHPLAPPWLQTSFVHMCFKLYALYRVRVHITMKYSRDFIVCHM
jgi:hypothetical protein